MHCQLFKSKALQLVLLIIIILSGKSFAGWVIYEKSFESGSNIESKYIFYIQDQKLKLVEDDLETIFDVGKNAITFIIPSKSIYWEGQVDVYNASYREILNKYFEDQLKDTPKEKVEMARATYEYYLANLKDSTRMSQTGLDMLIMNTGKKTQIAGYEAIMYGLYVNKDLRKEIWISKEINMNPEIDMVKYNVMLNEIGMGMMNDLNSRASDAYAQLLKSGFLMKTVEFGYDLSFTTEVYKIKEKKLNRKIFTPPAKYKKVPLSDLGLFNNNSF